ncbi:nucleoside 2-deoxyribosyltransferase [Brevibacterium otitidis]|uniref:Nucleoside 2-deoxyribosyltransferase n=1 Tax=Brevibacterium otitidis TaxID=53364 RepID=A0ABV5WYR7_9MICO|nr:hypothetical protein GCM10023233_00290 [Brevibacterium otitidis]BFF08595.1 hypothetical protein GCM10023233_35640 [Brevibacterium otitidis]
MTETRKMFLAGPFKALVDSDIHVMRGSDIDKYASIIDYFETRGWDVHCAHRREDWGRDFMEPSECTRIDYTEIAACDVFIAFPGSPASPGTHIEIGWASAWKKPIILLLEKDQEYAFLIRGLSAVADVEMITIDPQQATGPRIHAAIDRAREGARSEA